MEKNWLNVVKRNENAIIVYPPIFDRKRRAFPIIEQNKDKFLLIPLNLSENCIEDKIEWEKFISQQNLKSSLKSKAIIIMDGEELFTLKSNLLNTLADFYIKNQDISIIILSEVYPYKNIPPALLQNIIFQPLYDLPDVEVFIHYLEVKFSIKVTFEMKRKLWQKCGGNIWLIKEAIRFLSSKNDIDPFVQEGIRIKLSKVYENFSENEKKVLAQIASGQIPVFVEEFNVLTKLRIIKDKKISYGLLNDYVKSLLIKQNCLLLRNNDIYFGNAKVDDFFTTKEQRALKLLLQKSNSIVTREELAKAYWGKDDVEFTDWALDQAVKRIRKKINKLGLPKEYLHTEKGKGYYVRS